MRPPDENPVNETADAVKEDQSAQIRGLRAGMPGLFTCPDCGGVLWQVREPELIYFRCHVGHIVAGELLFERQAELAENALWRAIRTLADRSVLGRQLAAFARDRRDQAAEERFEAAARKAERSSETLKKLAESEEA